MGFVHGKNSFFQIGSHNITSYCDNIEATQTADTAETSTMGNVAKTYIVGLTDGTLTLSGKWDSTTTTNEVQTLSQATGTVTAGNYTLSFDGQTTANIAWNANAAAIQSALDLLTAEQGAGQIVVGGGTLPGTPVTFTFSGTAWAGSSVPLMTVNSAGLTGGTYQIVQTTPGAGGPDKVLQAYVGQGAQSFIYGPQGRGAVGSGNVKYTGTGILTSYKVTAPIGGVVAWTADFQTTPGSIVRGNF